MEGYFNYKITVPKENGDTFELHVVDRDRRMTDALRNGLILAGYKDVRMFVESSEWTEI